MPTTPHTTTSALHSAITEFSGKTGVNAATICTVAEKFIGLLSARFDHIVDVAMDEENNGKVAVGFRVSFDMMTRKAPTGTVVLSFTQQTKDESDFQVPDPEQSALPFMERPPTQSAATSGTSQRPLPPTTPTSRRRGARLATAQTDVG